jgi:predicted ATPase
VLSTLFRRLQQPTMIILEDIHWAGTESLAVLNQLNQIIADLALMVIASFRDDEQPDLPTKFPSMRLVHLERLNAREISELSESILGAGGKQPTVIDLLRKETEGNVFFLVEVMRVLAEEAGELERIGSMPLPRQVIAGGVQQIVQRRLDRVPARWRLLLNLAAVGGRQLDLSVLRDAIGDCRQSRYPVAAERSR